MAGRSYGYNFGSSSSSPYSFSSNYSSGLSYHGSSSGFGSSASRILSGFGSSSGLSSSFSSSFDLPRPKSFGLKPALHFHSPCRVIKSSFMPSILESPRPTPPPPSVYRPLPSSTYSSTLIGSGGTGNRAGNDTSYRRMNVRNTANIDVVNRPPSRLEHQPRDQPNSSNRKEPNEASRPPAYSAPIQRDYTVGTLKRGRKVIRLQTNRLPSPETIAKEETKQNEPVKNVAANLDMNEDKEEDVRKAKPAIRAYGGAERTPLPVVTEVKPTRTAPMTPGEKMKKKYMLLSRKGPKKESEPTKIRQSRLEELSTVLPIIADSPAVSPPSSPKLMSSSKPSLPVASLPDPSPPEPPKPEPSLPKPSKPVPIPAAPVNRPPLPVTLVSPSKDSGLGSSPVVLIPPVYNPHYRDPKIKFLPRPQQSRISSS